jgi:hypothetical protein
MLSMPATDPDVRRMVIEAKRRCIEALAANAVAANSRRRLPHSDEEVAAIRTALDLAARAARRNDCDISDLVGENVGREAPVVGSPVRS